MGMKVSVIVTCWKRFDHLLDIIDAWAAQPEVGEIILWDNSEGRIPPDVLGGLGERTATGRLWLIRSTRNYGSSARYALSSLAKFPALLFADDDVMPHPGLTADLLAHWSPSRMVGVKGRIFNGAYHGNTEVRGEHMAPGAEPVLVDMLIGHIMLTHRDWLMPYNFADAAWFCCELELQGRIKESVREDPRTGPFDLFVVPTINHHDLPAQTDGNALYRQAGADAEKQLVWDRYFKGRCIQDEA